MDGIVTGQATARVVGMHAPRPAAAPGTDPAVPADRQDFTSGLVLADDLPDGLVIADRAGKVAVFNRAAARLTGVSPDGRTRPGRPAGAAAAGQGRPLLVDA